MRLHLICFVFTLASCSPNRDAATSSQDMLQENGQTCLVYKVVDGDTFWGRTTNGMEIKVRFIGIDAPESRKTQKSEIEYFSKESSEFLRKLIYNKTVRLEYDVDPLDRYGRTLAYVYVGKVFVNAEIVKNGYATVMTVPPNVKFADMFLKLQRNAREKGLGLWGRPL